MKNALFRFLFIYFILASAVWLWFEDVPGISFFADLYTQLENRIVTGLNNYLFHISEELVPQAGSGDTSYGWAQLSTNILIAALGAVVWTVIDRKRRHEYRQLAWLLRNYVRYYVAMISPRLWYYQVVWTPDGLPVLESTGHSNGRFLTNEAFLAIYWVLYTLTVLRRGHGDACRCAFAVSAHGDDWCPFGRRGFC